MVPNQYKRPFSVNDLVTIGGYGFEIYQIVGKNTKRSYDPIAGVVEETIYSLINIDNANDDLKGFEEDLTLVAYAEYAVRFIQEHKAKAKWNNSSASAFGTTERHKASLRAEQRVPTPYNKRDIQNKIDEQLDWYADVLSLNAVLGENGARKLRIKLIHKELESLHTQLSVGFDV